MRFSTSVQHIGPGKVAGRLIDLWAIRGSNHDMYRINQIMDSAFQNMYKMTPVKTGYLRSTEKLDKGKNTSVIMVTAYYARFVDQGRSPTGPRRPQPFFSNNVVSLAADLIIAMRNLYGMVR